MKRFLFVFFVLGLILFSPAKILAYYTNMPASVVIDQANFTSTNSAIRASNFSGVRGAFIDPAGHLIVAETTANRVLIWNKVPNINGVPADLVLGQADFTHGTSNRGLSTAANTLANPIGIFSDGQRLFIGDEVNRRLLIWNTFPTQNGQSADVVVGKSTMTDATTNTCTASNTSSGGYGISVYNNKLIVSERVQSSGQNRILIWNNVPTTNGVAADTVLGQPDMTTCGAQPISASTFNEPRSLYVDNTGKLYVADTLNDRVLIWNSVPTTNNQSADVVVGQPDFVTNTGSLSGSKLGTVQGVLVYNNRLFVSGDGSRALIWNKIPTTNGATADIVLGQPDFVSNSA